MPYQLISILAPYTGKVAPTVEEMLVDPQARFSACLLDDLTEEGLKQAAEDIGWAHIRDKFPDRLRPARQAKGEDIT